MSTTELKPRKRDPHVCMRCNSRDVSVEHYSDVLDFKGLTLEVDGLAQTRCKNCDYRWTTAGQEQDNLARLREAYAAKRDAVRDREGLLTGEQIGYVLSELQLSKAEAAELFGGGPHAFSKYMTGEVLQSFAMDRLLRLALAFGPRAIEVLKKGRNAPLRLNCGYSPMSTVSTSNRAVLVRIFDEYQQRLNSVASFDKEHALVYEFSKEVAAAGTLVPFSSAKRWFATFCVDNDVEVEEASDAATAGSATVTPIHVNQ